MESCLFAGLARLACWSCCGCSGLGTDVWTLADAALGAVVDGVLDCLGAATSAGSSSDVGPFLAVCRWWFSVAVCRPSAFRAPVSDWHADACRQLDEQFARMGEPPWDHESEDLHLVLQGGLEHAEQELRLTELSASFPAGTTVVLLRFARRLGGLLRWVAAVPRQPTALHGCPLRRRYLQKEAEEFQRRVALLADASRELRGRLPDPELPLRWAQWFEETGAAVGFPEVHLQRFRSQREQVAAVWANNRRTFLSADEHVEALLSSLGELDDLLGTSDDEDSGGSTLLTVASHQQCLHRRIACT